MFQFFVRPEQITGNKIYIEGQDVNHIKNVLRMKTGEEIAVSNGSDGREYRCIIAEIGQEQVICDLCFIREDAVELPSRVYLFQGLPKGDKMELIIQKAVELGVYEIIPMETKRAVVKLDDKKAKSKIARWQGIAEAAAKQSKRLVIPKVHEVMKFKEALAYAGELDVRLMPYELATGMKKTREVFESLEKGQSIGILIGPEGGFDEGEVEAAMEAGITPLTLGKRILRTETAGFTTLALIMYQLEES